MRRGSSETRKDSYSETHFQTYIYMINIFFLLPQLTLYWGAKLYLKEKVNQTACKVSIISQNTVLFGGKKKYFVVGNGQVEIGLVQVFGKRQMLCPYYDFDLLVHKSLSEDLCMSVWVFGQSNSIRTGRYEMYFCDILKFSRQRQFNFCSNVARMCLPEMYFLDLHK